MSKVIPAGKILGAIDQLQAGIEDIAARSEKLQQDFQTRIARERRACENAVGEVTKDLTTVLTDAETEFQSAKAAAEAKFEGRKKRIGQAYQASKEQGLRKVEESIGALKYELQKKMLQAEKDRDAGHAATTTHFQDFKTRLAAEQETLLRLEDATTGAFKWYGSLTAGFRRAREVAEADRSSGEDQLFSTLQEHNKRATAELDRFGQFYLLRLFRVWPIWVVLALCAFALVPALANFGIQSFTYNEAALTAVAALVVVFAARGVSAYRARALGDSIAKLVASARRLHDTAQLAADAHYQQEWQRIINEFASTTENSDRLLKKTLSEAGDKRVACRMRSDQRTVQANKTNERLRQANRQRIEREHHDRTQRLQQAAQVRLKALNDACEEKVKRITADWNAARQALEAEWRSRLEPLYGGMDAARLTAQKLFPPWTAPELTHWTPPTELAQAAQFAELKVDVRKLCHSMPKDKALALPGPEAFSVPLCLAFPAQGSLLVATGASGHEQAIGALNNVILRLLSTSPPGRLHFTILDPVGLGQNFAGVMHLADYEEQIINSRIWTQSVQIEQKLAELNEHMEKVIQMYLRNEYATIAEYNEQAGVIAEKYHFLVIADFPANFTDVAGKRLLSIAASGARCGVYTLIHWDQRLPLPQDFIPDELRKASFCLTAKGAPFFISNWSRTGTELLLDEPPSAEVATQFIHEVGRFSRDSSRVEVPFEQVAPAEAELWTEDTTSELRVPIGRTGATKLQYLEIGKGTRQHGLIAGKTGSGKSTLFHVIITNLALWASPEEVEFYLVDFKKGVEFKCYAAERLAHARVVAIESDREFGLSVLQRVDEELKHRGDLFRELGVQDMPGYKKAGGKEAMPRTLLLIDEFQEFFVEDDKVSQTASQLLDRIVRQGRAFGIHVLLGSQTLGGAYTVARTTLGQMVIRIALQCNEADAYLIMDDNNPAPRLLSRPGEGIYNDMAGTLEGNSPFQVVWLPEDVRDRYLTKVSERASRTGRDYPGPIVFEGNAPADVRENPLLRRLLAAPSVAPVAAPRIWLGAPNSIKGPTEAIFSRQSGNNLLIVGQRDETILAICSIGLITLGAQYAPGAARFIVCDASAPGSTQREYLGKLLGLLPHKVILAKPSEVPGFMSELGTEMKARAEETDPDAAPPVFMFILGLQRFSKLRYEEDFAFSSSAAEAGAEVKPGAVLNDLVCEGTRLGFHVIASCDTYNNVSRFLSRKALSEFEMRILFQMSANDSASLIDNPKAGLLGLHRALFFNAQEGYLETFRPYALPGNDWLEETARSLARLANHVTA